MRAGADDELARKMTDFIFETAGDPQSALTSPLTTIGRAIDVAGFENKIPTEVELINRGNIQLNNILGSISPEIVNAKKSIIDNTIHTSWEMHESRMAALPDDVKTKSFGIEQISFDGKRPSVAIPMVAGILEGVVGGIQGGLIMVQRLICQRSN